MIWGNTHDTVLIAFFRQGTKQNKKDNSKFVKKQNRAEKHN